MHDSVNSELALYSLPQIVGSMSAQITPSEVALVGRQLDVFHRIAVASELAVGHLRAGRGVTVRWGHTAARGQRARS